jgi:hypothetical protein
MSSPLDPLQQSVDEIVSAWPDVRAKQVFGHRGYVRCGHMFGFLAAGGVAFKTARADAEELYASGVAIPFVYGGSSEMRGWPVVPLGSEADLSDALTRLQAAYEALVPEGGS